MKLFYSATVLIVFIFHFSFAQQSYQIHSFNKTPVDFKLLLLSNDKIAVNDTINERILDLVNPMLLDSMIERKRQHHRLVLGTGWLIHFFGGYDWRAVNMHKEKFVGTATRSTRSSKAQYTEYDINFDLNFHLHKYLFHVFQSYDLQKEIGRQDYRGKNFVKDYNAPPFMRDTNNLDITKYRLHCELTPPEKYREQLNELFYPTMPDGRGLKDHSNFGVEFPCMGFYGTSCLDCNHSCHPEIHPYEWTWWLKATPDDESTKKIWCIGLFHESSNRMHKWSRNPMTGSISIPFAFENATDTNRYFNIDIDHLVAGTFLPEELKQIPGAENLIYADGSNYEEIIAVNDSSEINLIISLAPWLITKGLRFWLSNLNYDSDKNILSGYLHFAASVEDLYTTRITFESREVEYEN